MSGNSFFYVVLFFTSILNTIKRTNPISNSNLWRYNDRIIVNRV